MSLETLLKFSSKYFRNFILIFSIAFLPLFSCFCCLEVHADSNLSRCCDSPETDSHAEADEPCCTDCIFQSNPRDVFFEALHQDREFKVEQTLDEFSEFFLTEINFKNEGLISLRYYESSNFHSFNVLVSNPSRAPPSLYS